MREMSMNSFINNMKLFLICVVFSYPVFNLNAQEKEINENKKIIYLGFDFKNGEINCH